MTSHRPNPGTQSLGWTVMTYARPETVPLASRLRHRVRLVTVDLPGDRATTLTRRAKWHASPSQHSLHHLERNPAKAWVESYQNHSRHPPPRTMASPACLWIICYHTIVCQYATRYPRLARYAGAIAKWIRCHVARTHLQAPAQVRRDCLPESGSSESIPYLLLSI